MQGRSSSSLTNLEQKSLHITGCDQCHLRSTTERNSDPPWGLNDHRLRWFSKRRKIYMLWRETRVSDWDDLGGLHASDPAVLDHEGRIGSWWTHGEEDFLGTAWHMRQEWNQGRKVSSKVTSGGSGWGQKSHRSIYWRRKSEGRLQFI